uniref:Uncharacterized protein n=1 Tax=Phocoena sinus TaxID=42100 RepID=A0A8C9BX27_PHOSS
MEPRVVRPLGQDLMVERLKSCYGVGGGYPAEVRSCPACRPMPSPRDFGFCSRGDEAGPSLRCYSDERRRGPASPRGALKRGTVSWQGSPSPARASPGHLGKLRRVRGCLCVCFSLRGAC